MPRSPRLDGMSAASNTSEEPDGPDGDAVEAATAWFVRMRSDPVTARDRRDFEAWLARDSGHADAYARAAALWDELGGMPDPRPRRRGAAARGIRRLAPGLYGSAAACAALAAVALWWSGGGYDRLRADHATAVGEVRSLALPDGSVVELGTDTALAIRFSADRRRIELYRGEAFFTVAADPGRPFEVAAEQGVSRALGTAFNVEDEGRSVTVTVEHGRVMVTGPAGGRGEVPADARDPEAAAVILAAGESARYGPGPVARSRVDPQAATAWRQGRLVFANWSLRDVVAELDRFRPGAIVFLDAAVADARFTGAVSLRDTDRALDAIEAALPVDVLRLTPYLTVLRTRG